MIIGLYIIGAYLITLLIPHEAYLIKSIIGFPLLVFYPILLGKALVPFSKQSYSGTTKAAVQWLIGIVALLVASYLGYAFQIFNWKGILFVLFILSFGSIAIRDRFRFSLRFLRVFSWNLAVPIIVLLAISVSVIGFFRAYSPFPLQSGNDNIYQAGLALEIASNDMSNSSFYVYSYPPIIPLLLAESSTLSHTEPIHMLWFAPFLLAFIFGVGLYVFIEKALHEKLPALFGAIIAVSLVGYQGRVMDLINFRAKILLYALIPLILCIIIESGFINQKNKRTSVYNALLILFSSAAVSSASLLLHISYAYVLFFILVVLFSALFIKKEDKNLLPAIFIGVTLSFLHSYSGLFLALLLSILIISSLKLEVHWVGVAMKVLTFALILFSVFILANEGVITSGQDFGESIIFGGQYNYDSTTKLLLLQESIPLLLLVLAVFGFLSVILDHRDDLFPYALMLAIGCLLYVLPLNFSYRLIEIIAPFVILFASLGMLSIQRFLSSHSRALRISAMSLLLVATLIASFSTMTNYIAWLFENNISDIRIGITNYTKAEYDAALWIKQQYGSDALIFTSPELTRSFTAIAGQTMMMRSVVQQYAYNVEITYESSKQVCGEFYVNGVRINKSRIQFGQAKVSFAIQTVVKDYFDEKSNTIKISGCSVDIVPVVSLHVGNGELKNLLEPKSGDGYIEYSFLDKPEALKRYSVSIFDGVDDLRELRREIFAEENPAKAHEKALILANYYTNGLVGEKNTNGNQILNSLIVVSGASAKWSENKLVSLNMAVPFESFPGFNKFKNAEYFRPVYTEENQVYVFELVNR